MGCTAHHIWPTHEHRHACLFGSFRCYLCCGKFSDFNSLLLSLSHMIDGCVVMASKDNAALMARVCDDLAVRSGILSRLLLPHLAIVLKLVFRYFQLAQII